MKSFESSNMKKVWGFFMVTFKRHCVWKKEKDERKLNFDHLIKVLVAFVLLYNSREFHSCAQAPNLPILVFYLHLVLPSAVFLSLPLHRWHFCPSVFVPPFLLVCIKLSFSNVLSVKCMATIVEFYFISFHNYSCIKKWDCGAKILKNIHLCT